MNQVGEHNELPRNGKLRGSYEPSKTFLGTVDRTRQNTAEHERYHFKERGQPST